MKKKIILFLSFLMVAVCLTGCGTKEGSTKITSNEISEITEVAENIKNNPAYELPEGYTFEIENNSKNGRIIISTKAEINNNETIRVTFDISKDVVQLIQIEEICTINYSAIMYYACVISIIVGIIIGIIIVAIWKKS